MSCVAVIIFQLLFCGHSVASAQCSVRGGDVWAECLGKHQYYTTLGRHILHTSLSSSSKTHQAAIVF